nr:MAG TPA: hypothetical protein [Caudoviricetes sp.]
MLHNTKKPRLFSQGALINDELLLLLYSRLPPEKV